MAGEPQKGNHGDNARLRDLSKHLGPAALILPLDGGFGEKLSWHYWDCFAAGRQGSEPRVQPDLKLLQSSELDEKSLEEISAAAQAAVQRGEACCAVHNESRNVWYVLDACRRHKDKDFTS